MIDWQRADALMVQVQSGDDAAAEDLVRLTGGWLRMCLLAYIDDPALVDDLRQELFIDLIEHPHDYTPGTQFGAYLKTKARYAALTAIRAQQRRHVATQRYTAHLRYELAGSLSDEMVNSRDRTEHLRRCRDHLSGSANDLLRLCYDERMPVHTISDRLGRSPDWVRSTLHRIRLELARCLQRTLGVEA